ncbi:hypothetical protein B0O99DRAFT_742691 [Bisporella sp. PMI_857]|nr:hypothetical protein B0O99DRAFT_742691 [Bisporella sp. PMI_857]
MINFSKIFLTVLLTVVVVVESRIPDETSRVQPTPFQLRNEVIKSSFPPLGGSKPGTGNSSPSAFKELQLNLCNSGWAGCYKGGRSITAGSSAIKSISPNIITVNEICSDDVTQKLQPSLATVWPKDWTYSVFMPAIYKANDSIYHCRNGDYYGGAVIGRVPVANWKGVTAYGGKYSSQWPSSQEQRVFACAAAGDHFACTTHLAAAGDPTVEKTALAQCKALMFDVIPYLKGLSGSSGRTVVGGDLNLEYDTSDDENVQKCVPNGYTRKGDGDVQHVIVSNDFTFKSVKEQHVDYTDHNAFIADLTV